LFDEQGIEINRKVIFELSREVGTIPIQLARLIALIEDVAGALRIATRCIRRRT